MQKKVLNKQISILILADFELFQIRGGGGGGGGGGEPLGETLPHKLPIPRAKIVNSASPSCNPSCRKYKGQPIETGLLVPSNPFVSKTCSRDKGIKANIH